MVVRHLPAAALRHAVTAYHGFESAEPPTRRREGPGADVVLILSFEHEWRIDGERRMSFAGGLRLDQVVTEHDGGMHGLQVSLAPWAAHMLLRVPQHELAGTSVPLEELLSPGLTERVGAEATWDARFEMLDRELGRRLADARRPDAGVLFAWERLRATHGAARIGAVAADLGWSRKRLAARFREQIGLTPKAAARLLRFERARSLAGTMSWGELAFTCGFADQPHLIAEFRSFTGRTPETFLQDTAGRAA
ncbi:MAG TPA: helix-turn-helix domain-containing protein [Gaiellaceae bacterium]|nr:helix-turn-helix domain-containing protein [Gaiellaceae bacterium]